MRITEKTAGNRRRLAARVFIIPAALLVALCGLNLLIKANLSSRGMIAASLAILFVETAVGVSLAFCASGIAVRKAGFRRLPGWRPMWRTVLYAALFLLFLLQSLFPEADLSVMDDLIAPVFAGTRKLLMRLELLEPGQSMGILAWFFHPLALHYLLAGLAAYLWVKSLSRPLPDPPSEPSP